MKLFENKTAKRTDLALVAIALLLLIAASQMGEGASISGDYAGDGNFFIRDHVGDILIEARGADCDMAFGHRFGDGEAFAGYDFDGVAGKMRAEGLFGPAHQMILSNATNISARATFGADYSWLNFAGIGHFEEAVIEAGKYGRPETLLEAEATGAYEINSSVRADPPETTTMD